MQLTRLLIASDDPSLGRADKASLSQETLMDLLTDGFTLNLERIFGNPKKKLKNREKLRFDPDGDVTHIYFCYKNLEGSVDLQWLPLTTTHAFFKVNSLHWSINLTVLPVPMIRLNMSRNSFSDSLDFTEIPPNIIFVELAQNRFSGVVDFTQLPEYLKLLEITHTDMEGEYRVVKGRHVRFDHSNVNEITES